MKGPLILGIIYLKILKSGWTIVGVKPADW